MCDGYNIATVMFCGCKFHAVFECYAVATKTYLGEGTLMTVNSV